MNYIYKAYIINKLRGNRMNFSDVVKEALEGNKIRRKDWHYTHYLYIDGLTLKFGYFQKKFVFNDLKKSYAEYLEAERKYKNYLAFEKQKLMDAGYVFELTHTPDLNVRDYLADDWEIVSEELHRKNTGNFQWDDWEVIE